jgi:hypothetical protein
MPTLRLHRIGNYKQKPTTKQYAKRVKKQKIYRASQKLVETKHSEQRYNERFTKQKHKIKVNIINSIQ